MRSIFASEVSQVPLASYSIVTAYYSSASGTPPHSEEASSEHSKHILQPHIRNLLLPVWPTLLCNIRMQISIEVEHADGIITELILLHKLSICCGNVMMWVTIGFQNHMFVTPYPGETEINISKFLRWLCVSALLKYIISEAWEIMPWSWNYDYLFATTSASFKQQRMKKEWHSSTTPLKPHLIQI